MTTANRLERSYRRLLRFYPASFRSEHEEEILAVLMAGSAPDQRRARAGDAVDLLANAAWMRIRVVRPRMLVRVSPFAYRHARLIIGIRLVSGLWLLVLAALLCSIGAWWGAVFVPVAALHFYLAARLAASI